MSAAAGPWAPALGRRGCPRALAPVPGLPKFILPDSGGLSCPPRAGGRTALLRDSRASPRPPALPGPPILSGSRPGHFLPRPHLPEHGTQCRGPGDVRRGPGTTPDSPAGRGLGLGRGRGVVLRTAASATAQEADPTAAGQVGRGGKWKLARVGERGPRAGAKHRPLPLWTPGDGVPPGERN